MRNTALRGLGRFGVFLALTVVSVLGLQAKNINLLNYTGYPGCPGYPLPPAQPSPYNNAIDVRQQLQAAIDDAASDGGGTVTIPGDLLFWNISKPVFLDRDNVTIDGTNAATLAPMAGYSGQYASQPVLVLGTPRQVSGVEITPSHRVDLAGILDSSIGAGSHYGLKTKGRNKANNADVYAHGYFDGSLLASGQPNTQNGFATQRWLCPLDGNGNPLANQYQFTFDIAIKNNAAGTLTGTICGSGMANDMTNPQTYWMLGTFPGDADPNTVKFKFKTGNPDAGTYTVQSLPLGTISDTNVHRITVQLDMGGGTCAAWLDGTQTATLALGSVLNGDGTLNLNKQMWRYEQGAFQLGALHSGALGDVTSSGVNSAQQQVDWTYCGIQFMSALRYTWATTLTRADNGQSWPRTDWDSWRYFNNWSGLPNFIANLQLNDNPTGNDADSIGTVASILQGGWQGQAFGFWLPQRGAFQNADTLYGVKNITLQHITVTGPVLVGEARSTTLTDVLFDRTSPVYAIDDLNCGVINSGVLPTFTDTDVVNNMLFIVYCFEYLASKNITSTYMYPITTAAGSIRLVGCQGSYRYTFYNAGGINEYYNKMYAGPCGGALTFDNFCLDNEGWPSPTKAAFYHEFSPLVNGVTRETNTFTLAGINTGTICGPTPIVQLPNTNPGTLQADRTSWGVVTEPYLLQQMVSTNNPNAYGAINITTPIYQHWSDDNGIFCGWFNYNASSIVYNDQDGKLYRGAIWHIPGSTYVTTNWYGNVMPVHEDNGPLTGEPWKAYWTRLATPATWSGSTAYNVGDVVSHYSGYNWYCLYKCLAANTGQEPANWGTDTTYWKSLQWQYGTAYTAGTSYVSCDGAYYQCIQNHTSGAYAAFTREPTRPRPWDVIAANAWQIVQYTGAGNTNIKSYHSEYSTALPPVAGHWNANELVIYNPNPATVNAPTEYRNPLGGSPGTWRSDDTLGTFVTP